MKDKIISSKVIRTIQDIPDNQPKEEQVSFHYCTSLSKKQNLLKKADEKGINPSKLIDMALEAFGI